MLPIFVSNDRGDEREKFAMFDSGSEELLLSQEVAHFLGLKGTATDFLMMTADGKQSPILSSIIDLKLSPLSRSVTYDITDVLVMESLPLIGSNYPCVDNLSNHERLKKLVPHFPNLKDNRLHLIVGAKETFLSHHARVRQAPIGKSWAAKTKLGWVIYGRDDSLRSTATKQVNVVKTFIEALDKKLDFWLESDFDESRRHDEKVTSSVNDKKAISKIRKVSDSRRGKALRTSATS